MADAKKHSSSSSVDTLEYFERNRRMLNKQNRLSAKVDLMLAIAGDKDQTQYSMRFILVVAEACGAYASDKDSRGQSGTCFKSVDSLLSDMGGCRKQSLYDGIKRAKETGWVIAKPGNKISNKPGVYVVNWMRILNNENRNSTVTKTATQQSRKPQLDSHENRNSTVTKTATRQSRKPDPEQLNEQLNEQYSADGSIDLSSGQAINQPTENAPRCGSDPTGPVRGLCNIIGLTFKPYYQTDYDKWRQSGAPDYVLRDAIRKQADAMRKGGNPPSSFKVFENTVQEAIERWKTDERTKPGSLTMDQRLAVRGYQDGGWRSTFTKQHFPTTDTGSELKQQSPARYAEVIAAPVVGNQ